MTCPACGFDLQKLSVNTTGGGKFDIDHCGRCGASWFDPYEINRIPYHEVTRIAKITVLPHTQPPINEIKRCPLDGRILTQTTAEVVPKDVRILRCPKCHGIFASQKALEDFKKNQTETIREYKTRSMVFPSLSVFFLPAIFSLLLFMTTYITISKFREDRDIRTKAAAYISNINIYAISDTDAGFTFRTNLPFVSSIAYGPSTFEYQTLPVSTYPATSHAIIIHGLKANLYYIYQITIINEKGEKITTEPQAFILKSK